MTWGYAEELNNARLDEITARAGNGAKLRGYTDPRPARAGAITTQTLLFEFTMGSPFAPGAASEVLSPTLPAPTTGLADGLVTWFRIVQTDGTTFVADGGIPSEMTVNQSQVQTGADVTMTAFTLTSGNRG